METVVHGVPKILYAKERKIGSEAPAISVKMLNGEIKVIGMMATKVQVMISVPYSHSLSTNLQELILRYQDQVFIYVIGSMTPARVINPACTSVDFADFAKKFGVYIDEHLCAKSLFIINQDGHVVYTQITPDIEDVFDLETFETKLDEAIHFKKKGHVHENWMGA